MTTTEDPKTITTLAHEAVDALYQLANNIDGDYEAHCMETGLTGRGPANPAEAFVALLHAAAMDITASGLGDHGTAQRFTDSGGFYRHDLRGDIAPPPSIIETILTGLGFTLNDGRGYRTHLKGTTRVVADLNVSASHAGGSSVELRSYSTRGGEYGTARATLTIAGTLRPALIETLISAFIS